MLSLNNAQGTDLLPGEVLQELRLVDGGKLGALVTNLSSVRFSDVDVTTGPTNNERPQASAELRLAFTAVGLEPVFVLGLVHTYARAHRQAVTVTGIPQEKPDSELTTVHLHPHGREVVTANGDELARWSLGAEPEMVTAVETSEPLLPGIVATGRIRVYDVEHGTLRWQRNPRVRADRSCDGFRAQVAFTPDGHSVLCSSRHGALLVFDAAQGWPVRRVQVTRTGPLRSFAVENADTILFVDVQITDLHFTPDGRALVAAWGTQGGAGVNGWDVSGTPLGQPRSTVVFHSDDESDIRIAVDPGGGLIAVWQGFGADLECFFGGFLTLVDLVTGQQVWSRPLDHEDFAPEFDPGLGEDLNNDGTELVFSPDSQMIMSGSGDGHLLQFDRRDDRLIGRLSTGVRGAITHLTFDRAGQHVWALADGRPTRVELR